MKLRIKGNSIRLRMTRTEVAELTSIGSVEERTVFGSEVESIFSYRIEKSDKSIVTAAFKEGTMTVSVPAGIAEEWAAGDQLGFSGRLTIENDGLLDILVEKDLTCLKPREREDESDNYPNPALKNLC